MARELRAQLSLFKKATNLHSTKVWGVPLEEIKSILEEIASKIPSIPNRVKISLALRECATLAEQAMSSFEAILEHSRFLQYTDDSETGEKLRPRLIDCELEAPLRIQLFKEITVRTYFRKRLIDDAGCNPKKLVEEMKSIDAFVDKATQRPILDELSNETLADFVQCANGPRFFLPWHF